MEQDNQALDEPTQNIPSSAGNSEIIVLASTYSRQRSLQKIRNGKAGLNAHRQSMLDRVPETGDWAAFQLNSLELIDLAYLSAKTGHEFAILRGKHKDILFHGSSGHCQFDVDLADMLVSHKFSLTGHSHPGEEQPVPSTADRKALRLLGQNRSTVISGMTAQTIDFGPDEFELFDIPSALDKP